MPRSSPTGVPRLLLALVAATMGLSGCRKQAPTSSPGRDSLPDDIAALEAEIQANAARLESEGVYVATAPTGAGLDAGYSRQASPPSPETPSDDGAGESVVDEDVGGDSADFENSPAVEPPRPTPPPPEAGPDEFESREPAERIESRDRRISKRRQKKTVADRCERICDLAAATCDLADHICALASRHPDEPRYEDACARANVQCEAASSACNECVG